MKRNKNNELFDDLGFEDESRRSEDDDIKEVTANDLSLEDDPEELERRRVKYASLKKSDKIFNNSYNMGQSASEDIIEARSHNDIKLDINSPHYHLYDRDQYSDHMDDTITQLDIDNYVSNSDEISTILGDQTVKKKFSKLEVNSLFNLIVDGVTSGSQSSSFVSTIHVLDSIASLTNMEYKKLFDMLTYENKEILLLELNKKYGFLDKPSRNLKMF